MSTMLAEIETPDLTDETVVTPARYKRTKVGILPEDWETRSLGEIGECLIGLTYDPSNITTDGLLVLRSSNIGGGGLQFHDNIFVDIRVPERIVVRNGDLLICVRNGSRSLIGKSALINERAEGMTFGAFMSVFRSPHNFFVFHCFQSDLVKQQIHEHLGATINQITNKSLNSFIVPFPEPAEQRAIAAALADVDGLIGALDTLLAKKRAIKQAAMQQLLTGKTRLPGFEGEWRKCRLADIGQFSKGSGIKRDDVADEGVGCIRYGEIYTVYNDYVLTPFSRIPSSVALGSSRLSTGDLLFAGSGETAEEIGKCVAFLGEERAYAGSDIVVLTPTGHDSMYLGHLMNHESVARQKARLAQGDAVVHISSRSLAQVEVSLPPLEEQRTIARILADIDSEIVALKRRREKTRAIKQGMMQALLTGRVRLSGEEGGA